MMNSKDLIATLFFPRARRRATIPGLAGPPRCGEGDLLIPQGLMANLLRRTGEGVLNLKDLLTISSQELSGDLSGSFRA